ncbi:MAG: site-2 protease family protein [Pseudomonadota bacterium]
MEAVIIVKRIVMFIVPFILSLSVHEFAHAWMANRLGDPTAKNLKRMTLDPRSHIDLFGSIIFPLINIIFPSALFFGWGKPVPVNHLNFKDAKKGMLWVSLAGPVSNVILAIICAVIYRIIINTYPIILMVNSGFTILQPLVIFLNIMISINVALAFFNMIPVPPLDGSKILAGVLPDKYTDLIYRYEQFGFFFLMILLITGLYRIFAFPAVLFIKILTGV